jgi:hypothetical protein
MIPPNYHAPTSCEGSDRVRRPDEQTKAMFSHLSPEERVRPDHPLRAIRRMTDQVLQELSPRFTRMYSDIGPPSIPPEQLLRALLLQGLYTIRSERLLIEEIDYSPMHSFIGRAKANKPSWRILATCSSTTVMGCWQRRSVDVSPPPRRLENETDHLRELRFDRNALVNTLDGLGIGARVTFSSSC